ncbi:AIM24 family protein [Streptomyces malaysiense]|uniref:AIM24 family protein n=1 Tax=Streptomyces malaysiense TaxID=1428626 RepID=A0A1J4PZ67_9ACTN|nr:AIM24 family protein [Streptomyces malaysiense]OIK26229.1 hypothetical protein VT52_018385 [Streptomyces malaysiense]
MKGDLFSGRHLVRAATGPGMSVENAECLRYAVDGEMYARRGSVVAHRGELRFERGGQGVGGMLKRAVTGEGLPLTVVHGQGEVWLAHGALNCFVVELEPGDRFTVGARHVLCFDPSLSYGIRTVKGSGVTAGGLFSSVFSGSGRLGLLCEGDPLVIPVSAEQPVYAGPDSVIGWSESLETSLHRSRSRGPVLRGGSGEAVRLMLRGEGVVVVRPSRLTRRDPQQH